MLHEQTSTKEFWYKSRTKQWLQENTDFKFPKTISPSLALREIVNWLQNVPQGDWVLKPNTGRQSMGVVLFTRAGNEYRIFSIDKWLTYTEFKRTIYEFAATREWQPAVNENWRGWFVEEWIKPSAYFQRFTDSPKVPPIIRFCGQPRIHFIGMSPLDKEITGYSVAGWKIRKYIWIDLTGKVRSSSEMNLKNIDGVSIRKVPEKNYPKSPIGEYIEGVPELVKEINEVIVPRIRLHKDHTWCCDGIFNENNEFVVIELNHGPGIQFRGFSW